MANPSLRSKIIGARFSRPQEKALLDFNKAFGEGAGGEPVEAVATVGGLGTGLIAPAASFVNITSAAATSQVALPAAKGGKVLRLFCNATGCELISSVAADKVNDVIVGATNEAALVAGTMYTLRYDGVDNWVMDGLTALGVVETPVVPDAL